MKFDRDIAIRAAAGLVAIASASSLITLPAAAQSRGAPQLTQAESDRIDQLIAQMTVTEKAGQMMQLTLGQFTSQIKTPENTIQIDEDKARDIITKYGLGSILNTAWVALDPEEWRRVVTQLQTIATEDTRLGIPIIYGVDSVHGANYVNGATIFPHNLTLAASFEPELSRLAGEITAAETRSVGLTWNFSPVADVMQTPLWSRVFETFGEDPYLASVMVAANVEGQQGDDVGTFKTLAATAKHFLGYSDPDTGRDRSPATIPAPVLQDTFVPPFDAAFDSGVRSIMINSGAVNLIPVHADETILTDLLREDLDYAGVAVTDWLDIIKLTNEHKVAANEKEATYMAIQAGVDMSMTPESTSFADYLVELVEEGRISEARLDESVRRILALKMELGLFDGKAMPDPAEPAVGTDRSRQVSLTAARRSITLLRNNDDTLPLQQGTKVLVAGPAADDLIPLNGSWTWSWQGTDPIYPDEPTILDAMKDQFGAANVRYAQGSTWTDATSIDEATRNARWADAIVLCLGELPSTEQPGDIADLNMSDAQIQVANALIETGKPVIAVLVTNRPRLITDFEQGLDAVIWTGHPGPEGPRALAEIIAGKTNPSGHLPFTYPRDPAGLHTYDHRTFDALGAIGFKPLFEFGTGLSYTSFDHANLRVNIPQGFPTTRGRRATVTVDVTNTGDRPGADVAMVFVQDVHATVSPRVKRLKAFGKVDLNPGQTRTLTFNLSPEDFHTFDRDGKLVYEPGQFKIMVGGMTEDIELN